MGKGDHRRPLSVDHKQFSDNWDAIFGKGKNASTKQGTLKRPKVDKSGFNFNLDYIPDRSRKKARDAVHEGMERQTLVRDGRGDEI